MKKIALVSTLRLSQKNISIADCYLRGVQSYLDQINADIVVCVDRSGSAADTEDQVAKICNHVDGKWKFHEISSTTTHLQSLKKIKEYLTSEFKEGEIESFNIISPSIQICKEMFLTTKYLASIVGYHKSEHDMYETIIDILKSLPGQGLSKSDSYQLGKFVFHSIHCDWPISEVERQIFSTTREIISDRYPSLDNSYVQWKKEK